MARKYKIKRYPSIYKRRRTSPVKLVLAAALVVALVFVAISLYGPVRDLLSGKLSASFVRENEPAPSLPGDSEPAVPTPSPTPAPSAPPAPENYIHAVYVPPRYVASGKAAEFARNTGLPDINSVLIDLKDDAGVVLYRSNLELVAQAGAQDARAVDLAAAVQQLNAAGYTVIGRIYAFRDPLASQAQPLAAIKYMNTQWTWLDNEEAAGGQPWLNPYSPIAQSYITDIAMEAMAAGIKTLVLDGVQFPERYGVDLATYGEWAAGKGKDAVLREFVEGARAQVSERGGHLLCLVPATDILRVNPLKYGGAVPSQLFEGMLGVAALPASFGDVFEGEGSFRLQSPALTPYETVKVVLSEVKNRSPGLTTTIPFLQGDTLEGPTAANNMPYTAQEVAQQVQAVRETGISNYVVMYEQEPVPYEPPPESPAPSPEASPAAEPPPPAPPQEEEGAGESSLGPYPVD